MGSDTVSSTKVKRSRVCFPGCPELLWKRYVFHKLPSCGVASNTAKLLMRDCFTCTVAIQKDTVTCLIQSQWLDVLQSICFYSLSPSVFSEVYLIIFSHSKGLYINLYAAFPLKHPGWLKIKVLKANRSTTSSSTLLELQKTTAVPIRIQSPLWSSEPNSTGLIIHLKDKRKGSIPKGPNPIQHSSAMQPQDKETNIALWKPSQLLPPSANSLPPSALESRIEP